MLAKNNRLTKKNDFAKVLEGKKNCFSDIFIVKFCQNDLLVSRVGIIVSTKVSKKAVERNNVKRQLSEIFRHNWANIKEGVDIVVITKNKILVEPYDSIENKLGNILAKVRLLKSL